MKGEWLARALACIIVLGTAGSAAAEEWVLAGSTPSSIWEIDASTLETKQDVVKSWSRETLAQPQRDEVSRKPFSVMLVQRSDDCAARRFALGAFVRRNPAGEVVSQANGGSGWQEVVPGTVAESIWKTVCAAGHPPKAAPLLRSIGAGNWRDLGPSADGKYRLWVKSDDVVKLDDHFIGSYQRTDYVRPEWIDGFAVRHAVAVSITDCVNETSAPAGMDLYISPNLRVKAVRIDNKDLKFEPIPPGSFLAKNLKDICSSAKPLAAKAPEPDKDKASGFSTGTAWGASKGYLVTAAHVIEGAEAIDVFRDGEKVGEAKVVVADFANDLAVLAFTKAPAGKLKVLPLARGTPALGRAVFSLGYPAPDVLGQAVKMTSGQINSTSGMQDDTRMLQVSIPLQGGNSGGPVLGWDGSVVGVVDMKLNRIDKDGRETAQNVNYAVKVSYLRPMLEDLPDLGNYEPIKVGPTQEKTISAVREAVFMLLVAHERR